MLLAIKQNWILSAITAFVLLLCCSLYFELYYTFLIPVFLGVLWAFVFRLDWIHSLLFIGIPLSVNIEDIGLGFGLSLPTEPLVFGLLLVVLVKLFERPLVIRQLFKHPLTWLVLTYLFWVFLTALTSVRIAVSMKFFISKLAYVLSFYVLGFVVLKDAPFKQMQRLFYLYAIPLALVIIYTLVRHTLHAYDEKAAHWVMQPFFKDHTIYGAIVAFICPFVLLHFFKKKDHFLAHFVAFLFLLIYTFGIIFSYTRAAWISLLGAFGLYIILKLKVKPVVLFLGGCALALLLLMNASEIQMSLEKNKQDSSDDLVEHVQSISNVASDASNLERLNRWNAALKMFAQRPVFGFGPGTYMFEYAPFQSSRDLTIISTNFGDAGNAHSEYLGPLAEMGLVGMLLMIAFVVYAFILGFRNYHFYKREEKHLLAAVFLGFMTYVAHGVLNNYLDTDKASCLFWTVLVFLVVVDMRRKQITSL